MMLLVTEEWKNAYPGAKVGMLVVHNVTNPKQHRALEQKKFDLEVFLKTKFKIRDGLLNYEPLQAYMNYYKRYKKTYHVLQQMESIIFKGKQIPCMAALVEAMFMAELKNGLLTAGHDMDLINIPLQLSIAKGGERFTGISGKEQVTKLGDMIMHDGHGIISSVLCGPDFRTRITYNTSRTVFVVYAPPGIKQGAIERHFDDIIENIKLFAPEAAVEFQKIYDA